MKVAIMSIILFGITYLILGIITALVIYCITAFIWCLIYFAAKQIENDETI